MSDELSSEEHLTAGGPLSSLLKGYPDQQIINKPLERLKRTRPKRPRPNQKAWQDNPSDLDEYAGYRFDIY